MAMEKRETGASTQLGSKARGLAKFLVSTRRPSRGNAERLAREHLSREGREELAHQAAASSGSRKGQYQQPWHKHTGT